MPLKANPTSSWNALVRHYYESIAHELVSAGLFVCAVNPQLIRSYQDEDNSLRKVKSDKADSLKIARYTLDR